MWAFLYKPDIKIVFRLWIDEMFGHCIFQLFFNCWYLDNNLDWYFIILIIKLSSAVYVKLHCGMHFVLCALPCRLWQWIFVDISGCIDFRTSVSLVAFETVQFMIVYGDFFPHVGPHFQITFNTISTSLPSSPLSNNSQFYIWRS